jgi:hypothetical protein
VSAAYALVLAVLLLPAATLGGHDDERADLLRQLGADVVVGDLTRPADMATAPDSVQRMFFNMSLAPTYLEATATVATVAGAVGHLDALLSLSEMNPNGSQRPSLSRPRAVPSEDGQQPQRPDPSLRRGAEMTFGAIASARGVTCPGRSVPGPPSAEARSRQGAMGRTDAETALSTDRVATLATTSVTKPSTIAVKAVNPAGRAVWSHTIPSKPIAAAGNVNDQSRAEGKPDIDWNQPELDHHHGDRVPAEGGGESVHRSAVKRVVGDASNHRRSRLQGKGRGKPLREAGSDEEPVQNDRDDQQPTDHPNPEPSLRQKMEECVRGSDRTHETAGCHGHQVAPRHALVVEIVEDPLSCRPPPDGDCHEGEHGNENASDRKVHLA